MTTINIIHDIYVEFACGRRQIRAWKTIEEDIIFPVLETLRNEMLREAFLTADFAPKAQADHLLVKFGLCACQVMLNGVGIVAYDASDWK